MTRRSRSAAAALSKRGDDVALLKGAFLVLKGMMSFVLAFQIASFVKLFMHGWRGLVDRAAL